MANHEFFREIEHREVPWGDRTIHVPVFYRDVETINAIFTASLQSVRRLLPSERIQPLRVSRRRCLLAITCHEFRDSDVGAYNEVAVSIPFTLDTQASILSMLRGRTPGEPMTYIHQLPVTTEVARDLGVEFAGYPKFLARIEFEEDAGWRTGHLHEGGAHILSLACRKLEPRDVPRYRSHPFTVRNDRLLRSEMILSERKSAGSRSASDVRLELGDHAIAQELRSLDIGRAVGCSHAPEYQIILTPVIESLPT